MAPAPDNTLAIVAIAVTGGSAIATSLISAIAAAKRQRRDLASVNDRLAAEKERLDAQLKSETERQQQQLDHQTEEIVRAGRLEVIDEIWAHMMKITDSWSAFAVAVDHQRSIEVRRPRAFEVWELLAKGGDLEVLSRIRFGDEHPIVDAFAGHARKIEAYLKLTEHDDLSEIDPEKASELEEGIKQFRGEFESAALAVFDPTDASALTDA